jgi:Zinc-ribbon/CHY zinc finger/Ring finger domain
MLSLLSHQSHDVRLPFYPRFCMLVSPFYAYPELRKSSLPFPKINLPMSEYLPSFIIEPVLRQARRLSRISTGDESPGFLPQVPDLQRWNPTRFWNTSPPPSIDEENSETTVQSIARTIQLWANQINNLDIDPIPSLPLEPMDEPPQQSRSLTQHDEPSTTEFPALDPLIAQQPRPYLQEASRTSSAHSLNPARELEARSRVLSDLERAHSRSDPVSLSHAGQSSRTMQRESLRGNEYTIDGYVRRRDGSDTLPEDDGMGPLRQRINAIWAGPGNASEKSKLIHALMTERYRIATQVLQVHKVERVSAPQRTGSPMSMLSGASQDPVFNLSDADMIPTYAPAEGPDPHEDPTEQPKPQLGCMHYRRNVKMQCATCERWHTCRLCHDEAEDHTLPRRETRYMLCMLCNTPQRASQICKMCTEQTACYYCSICKLWNNDPEKSVYHCDDCGICRLGKGLGKDFFHCKTCGACMSIQAESTHKCIEKSTKCDCPICGDYMFTSNKPVAFMRCGHSIHESCFARWCDTSYKCPICSKSIANMESQFRRLDRHIEEQPMPEEYRNKRAYIFCNDCNSRSVTSYHWLGLKCTLCESYNTSQLEMLGPDTTPEVQEQAERAQQLGVGEAGMTASQSHTPTEELTSPATTAMNVQSVAAAMARSPPTGSPWLLPHSPNSRSARSQSPIVGSYFATGQPMEAPRHGTPMEDDDDLNFWGAQSPRSQEALNTQESDESSSSEDLDAMDANDPDDEDEDAMDIFGHR